ncbi:MAG: cation diffusion facilitator family transporter [Gammaproteobacteria bacterium]
MFKSAMDWLGFGAKGHEAGHTHQGQGHSHDGGHGHTHGVIDPTIATTERGIWAIKWSFIILAIAAVFQILVVVVSGSVALLADTIHNVGDAVTAIPLWIAFVFARRKPSDQFTYGLGRVEDLAGMTIVGLILVSALVAGYQTIDRLIHPQAISFLGAVAAAGVVGFIGNEAVAVFRIRVGREINSAALIADGYHARVDGLTSLAVVGGALGVWLGFPLADPIVGGLITLLIFGIVWQSARAVFTRALDGVEPEFTALLRHTGEHVPGVRGVQNVRTRWIGHRMYAEADVVVDGSLLVREAAIITEKLHAQAQKHLPALASLRLALATGLDPDEAGRAERNPAPPHEHGDVAADHRDHDHDPGHGEHGHVH